MGLEVTLVPPRTYFLGRRVHHGLVGALMAVSGCALAATDWHDKKVWVKDFLRHPAFRAD